MCPCRIGIGMCPCRCSIEVCPCRSGIGVCCVWVVIGVSVTITAFNLNFSRRDDLYFKQCVHHPSYIKTDITFGL